MIVNMITDQDVRTVSTTKSGEWYGARAITADGRMFQYVKHGAALAAGHLTVAEADADNHINRTVSAAAIGATQVSVALGATAAAADLYAEGYLIVRDGTGEGHYHRIRGHAAAGVSGTLVANLYEPIEVALVASDTEVDLIKHPAKDCAESTTLAKAIGVANVAFASGEYGWVQTYGICSVLSDGTPAKNVRVIQSNGTAGAVEVQVETDVIETVGVVMETLVNGEEKAVYLSIA